MDWNMQITRELLEANGWESHYNTVGDHTYWQYSNIRHHDGWYAEFVAGRNTLKIWQEEPDDAYDPDVFVRVADKMWKFFQAFRIADIRYKLSTPASMQRFERMVEEIKPTIYRDCYETQ